MLTNFMTAIEQVKWTYNKESSRHKDAATLQYRFQLEISHNTCFQGLSATLHNTHYLCCMYIEVD